MVRHDQMRTFVTERHPDDDLDLEIAEHEAPHLVPGNLTSLEAGGPSVSLPGNATLTGWVAQRKVGEGGGAGTTTTSAGTSLVRAALEAALDLSAVRIHVGPQAAAIGARAYTRGTDVYEASGSASATPSLHRWK